MSDPTGGRVNPPAYLLALLSGEADEAAPLEPAEDLFAALAAWFETRTDLAVVLPGGLVNTRAPVAQRTPYARASYSDPVQPTSLEDQGFEISFRVYATTDETAKAASDQLFLALKRTASRPPLLFRYEGEPWVEVAMRRLPTGGFVYLGRIGGGDDEWAYDGTAEFLARKDNPVT